MSPLAYVPSALYLRHVGEPYWLRILARQRAVYLKYNPYLPGTGFGWLAARGVLRRIRRTGWSWIFATASGVTAGRSRRWSAASGPTRPSTGLAGPSA